MDHLRLSAKRLPGEKFWTRAGASLADVSNVGSGFVEVNQKVKLEAYPFQKYAMLAGVVQHVTFEAADKPGDGAAEHKPAGGSLSYRALVALNASQLEAHGLRCELTPGMQVAAEVHLGVRPMVEYLLSPIQKTLHEAGRER